MATDEPKVYNHHFIRSISYTTVVVDGVVDVVLSVVGVCDGIGGAEDTGVVGAEDP